MEYTNSPHKKNAAFKLLAAVVVFLAGIVLRYWQIGSKPLWLDEAVGFWIASKPIAEIIKQAIATEAHPPLFFLLMHPFLSLGKNEVFLRFLPALFSCLSLPLIYLSAREFEKSIMPFLALVLFATSAFQIFFAQEARLYSLFTLLGLACYFLFLKIIRADSPNLKWLWVAYVFVCVMGLYTHVYFVFIILSANVTFFALRFLGRKAENTSESFGGPGLSDPGMVKRWLLAHLIIAVFFLPWFPVVWQKLKFLSGGQFKDVLSSAGSITPFTLVLVFHQINTGFGVVTRSLLITVSVIYFVFLVIGLWPRIPKGLSNKPGSKKMLNFVREYLNSPAGITAVFFFVPLGCVVFSPAKVHLFESKHLAFIAPFYYLIIAYGLAKICRQRISFTVVMLMLAFNCGHLGIYFSGHFVKEDWRGAAGYVQEKALKTDIICFNPGYAGFAFDYYYQGRLPRLDIADISGPEKEKGVSEKLVVAQENSSDKTLQEVKRIWLVENYSLVSRPDKKMGSWLENNMKLLEEKKYRGSLGIINISLYENVEGQ